MKLGRKRILIVDDHPVVREGLAERIGREPDLEVVAAAEDAASAIDAVRRHAPDMALVDISLKSGSGLDLIKTLKIIRPKLRILVISMHDESLYAKRAIRAGALGYVSKQEPMADILRAVRKVIAGEVAVSENFTRAALLDLAGRRKHSKSAPTEELSDRELEILRLLGRGRSTRQIAGELNISVKTVETYRLRIKKKLNIPTAAGLIRYAARWIAD